MFSKLGDALNKICKRTLTEENMTKTLEELKIILIKHDVAVKTAEDIVEITKNNMLGEQVGLFSLKKSLTEALKDGIKQILSIGLEFNLIDDIEKKKSINKPYVILVLGVNGTGKTTTIAKLVNYLKKNKITSVVAASDTFRAGAIEQLEKHLNNLGVRLIKGQYNSDPASIGFDAINHAISKHLSVVIIDTAGRQTNNKNLMEQLKKIKRVNNPDLTLFIGDSLAGNDVLIQAKNFNDEIGIDASIITKLDADSKGGAALSIAHVTRKPILFVGTGQKYDDLEPFNPDWLINKILGR